MCPQVSIVSQEPVLFAESILYNITFGVQDPDSISLAQVHLASCSDPSGLNCQSAILYWRAATSEVVAQRPLQAPAYLPAW